MNSNLRSVIESIIGDSIIGVIPSVGKIVSNSGEKYFFKSGEASRKFHCEANGLNELAKNNILPTAKVVSVGENYILTEFVEESAKPNGFFEYFGKKLAQLHRIQASHFGFYEDNYIGDNPQINIPTIGERTNWIEFYFNKRLLFQYKLAEKNGHISDTLKAGFQKLETRIELILKDSAEPPTLLHGDLWSGNFLVNPQGLPTLLDPAVYYGHKEADLAMTKIFGGFPPTFYQAYQQEYPLQERWEYREDIYKLYHILNHLNIFGRSYLSETEFIIKKYTN